MLTATGQIRVDNETFETTMRVVVESVDIKYNLTPHEAYALYYGIEAALLTMADFDENFMHE